MPRLLLPLLLLALSACATGGGVGGGGAEPRGGSGPAASPTPTAAADSSPSSSDGDQAYVGLSEQEALAKAASAGVPARVVQRDDESLAVTMDYREDRLNFVVQGGEVTAVHRG